MKNMLILALLMVSTAAYAQTAPSGGGSVAAPPGQSGGAQAGGQGQGQPGERFEEHKAKIVARLQEKLACAQAAQNHQQMEACFPEREQRGGGGGGWKSNNGNGGGFGGGRAQNNGNGGNSGNAPGQQ